MALNTGERAGEEGGEGRGEGRAVMRFPGTKVVNLRLAVMGVTCMYMHIFINENLAAGITSQRMNTIPPPTRTTQLL